MTSEAFLVGGVRTPFGRYRGALAEARPDDLAAESLKAALERAAVPGDQVDDVIFGAANQAGEDNRNVARMAVLLAGLPDDVPGYTVNRLCASGLQAIVSAAQQIRTGEADVVVAGGVESMTRAPMVLPKPGRAWGSSAEIADTTLGWRLVNPRMRELDGGKATISLGETAEEVAVLDGITREESDAFGLRSQQLAAATAETPEADLIEVAVDGGVVAQDEVPRPDTTAEALAGLKPAFRRTGSSRRAARRRSPTGPGRSSWRANGPSSGSGSSPERGWSPRPPRACLLTSWVSGPCRRPRRCSSEPAGGSTISTRSRSTRRSRRR